MQAQELQQYGARTHPPASYHVHPLTYVREHMLTPAIITRRPRRYSSTEPASIPHPPVFHTYHTRSPEVIHAHACYDQAQAQEVQQYGAYTQHHCCEQRGKGVAPVDECVEALEHCREVVEKVLCQQGHRHSLHAGEGCGKMSRW